MARLVAWLIGVPLAVLVAAFAVANRHDMRLELWPFPWSLDLPVYLAVLGPLVAGLLLGMLLTGLSGLKTRTRVSAERRRADSLQRQLDAALKDADKARAEADAAKALPTPATPDRAA